jgi:thioredoxin-related protein
MNRTTPLMRTTLITLFIATLAAGRVAFGGAIDFHRGIEEARKAKNADRPIVILFGAEWCGWCRKMAADTLTDSKVLAIKDKYLWVKIDVDKEPEMAARFGVEGVPVTVVLDKQGRVLGAESGFLSPEKFVEFATKSLENPHPEELLRDLLARFAKSDVPAQRREIAARLVEQLARPDRVGREEILSAFKRKGATSWPVLVELMSDKRLSVRAAAGGALKHASKAELPFHPFANPPIRQQQVADWQKWVAAHTSGS